MMEHDSALEKTGRLRDALYIDRELIEARTPRARLVAESSRLRRQAHAGVLRKFDK